ncbi:hypothetical protein I3F58_06050 [Streptomyces sp. MUM 203J]|uniref:hypothetical protein n=1 Tax=Streptomyces sp. MUM 203J TaxID=2791990 RepID=UPI001F0417B0|nr:hypothetical protein [Streptomyces sp. MUM 203J]MCH0539126.1 hypothetical protein [Streptomyces sp. MUM 203J]
MTGNRSPLRLMRAALFAAVCVVLSATGHASQTAHRVPLGSLLTAFALTCGLAWVFGGRRRGAWSIGTGLLAVQGALHLTFAGARGHHGGGHGGGASLADALPTPGMTGAHLLAAAVCGLWLACGEAALFRLARTAFVPLRPPLTAVRLPLAPRPPRPVPRSRADQPTRGAVLARARTRRGPPVLAVPHHVVKALGAHA